MLQEAGFENLKTQAILGSFFLLRVLSSGCGPSATRSATYYSSSLTMMEPKSK